MERFGTLSDFPPQFRSCAQDARRCRRVSANATCDEQENRIELLRTALAGKETALADAEAANPNVVTYCAACEEQERIREESRPTTRDYVMTGVLAALNIGGQAFGTWAQYDATNRYNANVQQMHDRACRSRIDAGYFCNAPGGAGVGGGTGLGAMAMTPQLQLQLGIGNMGPGGYAVGQAGTPMFVNQSGSNLPGYVNPAGYTNGLPFVANGTGQVGQPNGYFQTQTAGGMNGGFGYVVNGGGGVQGQVTDPYVAMLIANGGGAGVRYVDPGAIALAQNSSYTASLNGVAGGLNAGWAGGSAGFNGTGSGGQPRFFGGM